MRLRKDDLHDLMGHHSIQSQARCQFLQPHHAPLCNDFGQHYWNPLELVEDLF